MLSPSIRIIVKWGLLTLLFGLLIPPSSLFASTSQTSIKIYAASSLTESLQKIATLWTKQNNGKAYFSFDSSARLANQIKYGAPVDIFFTAHYKWISYLESHELLSINQTKPFLGNSLVWAFPHNAPITFPVNPSKLTESQIMDITPIAIAGRHVPLGYYTNQALKHNHVWKPIEQKVVKGQNARTVSMWLVNNHVKSAIMYLTDALRNKEKLKIVYHFSSQSHDPITYTAAIVKTSTQKKIAKKFLDFCQTEDAKQIFLEHGFSWVHPK